ncbi:S-layer homology domain-containing protein [Paenibacillus harenae]|nr:S-layer homology domain-containing protein [Paenibacillus harenae]
MIMNALKPNSEGLPLTFSDTTNIAAWAQRAVAQALQAGIIHGYEDGSFRPNAPITRSEMAAIISSALKLSIEKVDVTGFADNDMIPAWARGAVEALHQLGLIQGKGDNAFDPSGKTTRAEAITVLLKMLALQSE